MLNLLSFGWMGAAVTLALAVPHLSGFPSWVMPTVSGFALTVSVILIVLNLVSAWRERRRANSLSAALPRTLLALALYCLLFVQIACHLGASHFESSAAPGPEDWLVFGASHVLRAADVVDAIEKLDLNIQAIRHNSPMVAMLLVGFHLITGLIVLEVLGQAVRAVKESLMGKADRVAFKAALLTNGWILVAAGGGAVVGMLGIRILGVENADRIVSLPVVGIIFVATLLLTAFLYRHRGPGGATGQGEIFSLVDLEGKLLHDLGSDRAKPLSGLIVAAGTIIGPVLLVGAGILSASILDGVKLYGVPAMSWWALDNVLRVFDVADIMALYDLRTHQVAGFWGETAAALTLRLLATVALGVVMDKLLRRKEGVRRNAPSGITAFARKGMASGVAVGLILVAAPFLVVRDWPGWSAAARRGADQLDNPSQRDAALESLRRMGLHATVALPALDRWADEGTLQECDKVIRTLEAMGPPAVPHLERVCRTREADRAILAAEAMGRMRPPPVAALVRSLDGNLDEVQTAVRIALRGIGRRAVPELRRSLTPKNAALLVPLLEEQEPYWYVPRYDDPDLANQVRQDYAAAKRRGD